jgi:hypothetical protein
MHLQQYEMLQIDYFNASQISENQKVYYFIKNLLSQTFNSQYSTNDLSKTFMPLYVMLFVNLYPIINEYGRDSCSFEAC